MTDLWRKLLTLFGAHYVALIDFDGERNIRRVYWRGGKAFAGRYSFAPVELLDDGEIRGPRYVSGWEPYHPLAARVWPRAPHAAA